MLKKIQSRPNLIPIILLLICSIFVCIPLFSSEIDISYDDGVQHIARLIGTEASIKEGQTSIMSDFCNGFGYSWNLFYSPVTAFLPLLFRVFGCSYVNCIKLFMFFVTFISGIAMYFFTKDVTKNRKIAVISGIIYIFVPYRFTDMYLRNALAELTSFAFIPMIFQGLYGIMKQKQNREVIFIIGTSLLILTHTVVTLYMAIICFIYLLTQFKQLKIKNVRRKLIYSIIVILLITSFFLLPLLQVKNSAQYEVFKPGRMERTDVLIAFKLDIIELFMTPNGSIMIFQIGLLNLIALIFTPLVIKKIRVKYKNTDFYKLYIFSIFMFLILSFMTLKVFPFEKLPGILKMIQFTFRLLEFTSFFISFIVAVNIGKLFKDLRYRTIILIMIFTMIFSAFFIPSIKFTGEIDETKLIPAVPVTEKTGRVHAGCASFEYLPSKAFENRKYIETRNNEIIVLNGEAEINNYTKNKSRLEFDIKAKDVELELPYIYYPGYTVKIENEEVKTYETEKGFVGVKINDIDNKTAKVEYTGTILMKLSKIISLFGIVLLVVPIIIRKVKNNKQ
ncbi:MAG: hypothetical protein J6M60_04285 [Clostridia bacterium]|nr:hypothetical protein [Clostridia bacterium]